jgi:pilus assembly protein Flp/PilA
MVKLYVTLLSFVSDLGGRLRNDDEGATAVEYGLMVALIAAVIVGVVTTLGQTLDHKFHDVLDAITG